MKKKNKGFTLIELIVTVAIIAIFSGVVLSVIGTGANSYIKTSNTAKSQMEAQDIMDQMENMIIDVNRSVYYAYGKGINDGYGNEIRNDIDSSDSSQSKTFFACSAEEKDAVQKKYAYSCDIIEWDSDEQKLYYGCRVWEGVETETTDNSAADGTENGNTGTDTQSITDNNAMVAGISDDSADNTNEKTEDNIIVKSKRTTEVTTKVEKTLIAEDITSFCVDVSKAQTDRIVRFQFTTNKKGKEITTIHTVNLRNQVQIGKPGDGYGTAENGNAWINIVDYPKEIKAFYMKLNQDGKTVAAMDCLVPGIGEIIGGSQREDSYEKLKTRMDELGLNEEDYGFYLDLRKYGSTRHSGFGLGFERCVMYLTGMQNIRDVIPFPRTVNNCDL